MVAIINNCSICSDLAHQTKDRYRKSAVGDSKAVGQFAAVLKTFEVRLTFRVNLLADVKLERHFQSYRV